MKGVEGPWANIALFFFLSLFALLSVNITLCCELEGTAFKKKNKKKKSEPEASCLLDGKMHEKQNMVNKLQLDMYVVP